MRNSVRNAFVDFSAKFEGVVPHMYLDIRGLVTTAIGNLVDPVDYAIVLPFMLPNGNFALPEEIRAEWLAVKAKQEWATMGGHAFARITSLRLTDDGIKTLVYRKLDEMAHKLSRRFPEFEAWPSDSQLGLLSMAWAAGPAFAAPLFEAACKEQDFATAAGQCRFNDTHNPGLRPRNDANEKLFKNAANVIAAGLNLEELYYPVTVLAPVIVKAGEDDPIV